eukprot:s3024_g5.t1
MRWTREFGTEWNMAHPVPVLKYQLFELWAPLGPDLEVLPPSKTLVRVQSCDKKKTHLSRDGGTGATAQLPDHAPISSFPGFQRVPENRARPRE